MTDPSNDNLPADAIPQIQLGGAPGQRRPRAPTDRGYAWAFSLIIDLSPAISAASDLSDPVDWESLATLAENSIIQILLRNGENVSITGMVAQFNASELQQPTHTPNTVSVNGFVQLKTNVREAAMKSWLPQCTWTMVRGGLHESVSFKAFEEKQGQWKSFSVKGQIGLNNAGRCVQKLQQVKKRQQWGPICIQLSKSESEYIYSLQN
jgi:hypothetical protein